MVRKGDELIHLSGYGYANLETGEEITPETVFDLGSLSKQFPAFAVLSIFKESELDTPISKFFRGLPRYADRITIKHLIHHTSALPDYIDLYVRQDAQLKIGTTRLWDGAMIGIPKCPTEGKRRNSRIETLSSWFFAKTCYLESLM